MVTQEHKTSLRADLSQAFDEFISTLGGFPDEWVNAKPFEGSWTPAQVARHIILATDGVPDERTEPARRPFDANIAKIRPWWEDFNQKFSTPEPLSPDATPAGKSELLSELRRIKAKDIAILDEMDVAAVCLDFELPTIGFLTRYEWLWFIQMHLRRHEFQLRNIYDALKASQTSAGTSR